METPKLESIGDHPAEFNPSGSGAVAQATMAIGAGVADVSIAAATAWRNPGTIGHYRLLRLLGEGGMGRVYLAEQENPHRIVALKVIKPGFVNAELMRRFEQEAQAPWPPAASWDSPDL